LFIFIYLLDYIFKHENVDQARAFTKSSDLS